MFRKSNPTNAYLSESICRFEVNSEDSPFSEDDLVSLLEKNGAHFLNQKNIKRFEVSHQKVDAFGGLWLLNQFVNDTPQITLESKPFWQGNIKDYTYHQSVKKTVPTINPDQTPSQKFIHDILSQLESSEVKTVALPIALDDLSKLTLQNVWGNSFLLVPLDLNHLRDLADLPKKEWVTNLQSRAKRLLRIMHRKPSHKMSWDVLISLVGNLEKLPWCSKKLTPNTFTMIPTPPDERSLNLVYWSSGGSEAFATCLHQDSQYQKLSKNLHLKWREDPNE